MQKNILTKFNDIGKFIEKYDLIDWRKIKYWYKTKKTKCGQ